MITSKYGFNKIVTILIFLTLLSCENRNHLVKSNKDNVEYEIPSQINLDTLILEEDIKFSFKIKNKGQTKLEINGLATSCGCTTVTEIPDSIEGETSFKITGLYKPRYLGHFNQSLLLHSNSKKSPDKIEITGFVVSKN